jgi:hypothetical protein
MPHLKSKRLCHTFPSQLLAIFTAALLLVPSVPARTEFADGQTSSETALAAAPVSEAPSSSSSTVENPDAQRKSAKLGCQDSNLESVAVLPSHRSPEADKWGDITVAQPKIWQFERVSALLDGLLRDVEGVSLADVTQLDPNQQNAAALKFIQSALEVGVQYDQAAAVNAANTLSSYNALHASQLQQLEQYNNYMQTLTAERDRLAAQYSAASNEVNALQALAAAGTITDAQKTQLAAATSRQTSTQASLTSVNSLISGAGAAPTLTAPPTVTSTTVQGPASGSTMSSSLSGFSDVLKNLPQGVQNNLSTALQSPSYPASKRLDNFVTLLYERLAREISVLQDDLTRDPENVAFLLQFDVGLYPSKKAKDHVARVEFNLDCPGCKVYSLYPGQSSYNLANYSGSSKRNTFWGNFLTLLGFGVSASYRRQTDMLQGSLVQSVYTAGFQNGVLGDNSPQNHGQVNANQAEQSFGWYYGAAPFEQVVTPGIRSTFALITVPRALIQNTQDRFGNTDACIPFHIDAGWANRNDPLAQNSYVSPVGSVLKQFRAPFYDPTRAELVASKADAKSNDWPYDKSVLTTETSVKLPGTLGDYSLVATREKQKLHVVRMEYDTVYEDPDAVANATVVHTTVQTSTQSTNQATGQTTGQTTSQTTGTAVAVANSAAAASTVDTSTALNPLPCPKGKCAPILLKLDRTIDPNLSVTVRGNPLMRVRDWRGRATSVLPAAQSGTDLSGAAAAAGSLSLKQLAQSRGLLETDQFAPNTWFALNSHELLLNISSDVATEAEFPVIQLADPSGSVVIPHDLRKSFTELIVDNFRMRPQTEQGIQMEVARQNWRDADPDTGARCLNYLEFVRSMEKSAMDGPTCVLPVGSKDAPISSGLYPFSTFSPLFSPQPAARKFFALVGETGEDLLVGSLSRPPAQKGTDRTPRYDWLAAQTRVILEDRDQDFAWSLSCDVQGEFLVCRIPRTEIKRVYQNFLRACPDSEACPGLETDYRPLMDSVSKTTEARSKSLQALLSETKLDIQNAFLSTMQLWVEQFDAEGKSVFYSPEPWHFGFFPISDDYWNPGHFKPWEFESANGDGVTLRECNYLPKPNKDQSDISVSLLGVPSWKNWIHQPKNGSDWIPLAPDGDCGTFAIPTAALTNNPVVFQMQFSPIGNTDPKPLRATITMPRFRIAPSPRESEIRVLHDFGSTLSSKNTPPQTKVWNIYIPIDHSTCFDRLDLNPNTLNQIHVQWLDGNTSLPPCPVKAGSDPTRPEYKAWKDANEAGRIRLSLEIPRSAIKDLPDESIHILRTTSDGSTWEVGTLPSLRRMLLPSRLAINPSAGTTQFAIQGEHADVIDEVILTNTTDGTTATIPAAPGLNYSLVTLPPSSSASSSDTTGGGGGTAGSTSSTQISIVTTKDNADTVKMTQSNSSTPAKAAAPDAKTPSSDDKTAPPKLTAGTYSVLPFMLVETPTQAQLDAKTNADNLVTTLTKKVSEAEQAAKGKAADSQQAKDLKQAQSDLANAKKAATKAANDAKTAEKYLPLNVTDEKGKPLVFTIPDAKKPSTTSPSTTPATSTTTCVAPCATLPCTVTCPQTPNQAGTPKTR